METGLNTTQMVDALPTQEPEHIQYHGLPVTAEASMTRDDSQTWYAVFFEQAECVPHRDGKHVIVRWPNLPRGHIHDYGRESTGWPVVKMQNVYRRLGEDNARIVRYGGILDDGSLLVERLWPGPFDFKLPVMTVPVPAKRDRNDQTMLSLYYRWALQGLAALAALHSRGIYLRTFSSQMVWLRSDYSLALTGFVGAEIAGDETDYGDGGRVREELMEFDEEAIHGCVKEDIYYWATFVWRLMTNDYTDDPPSVGTGCWEPCCPVEGGCKPYDDNREAFDERFLNNVWQELEEARLGKVLVNAWNRKYTTVDEVAENIRSIASNMNIAVIDDEVEIDGKWEDVFEVVETGLRPHARILRFKNPESGL
ncbi:uncharacterized protein M421DRAFT_425820 [Didymella exigua CBS 183.55]|uniref:Protein kinase domain-containing protein n=1 Tax=Didymella exigua CBS 183.55 TaxID=1150837 RepID=A0A6A5R8E0_9PLEO|nr:uncharacterized protein M421DRAFT_425820 [Didymella exigua CBS 183.55]KAF1923448.1 hypothetical protein M421DRAFT_425820 [Didymella exigua CBS 183.55]